MANKQKLKHTKKLKRTKRTAEQLLTEMGLDPEKLKQLKAKELSADELKKLIEDAVGETPIPAEAKKSVITHIYDAMSVIATAHGFWAFLRAIMEFASSLTMSASKPPKGRDPEKERALVEAQKLVVTINPSANSLSIVQTLRLHIEAAIKDGVVESGMNPSTAELIATSMGLQVQRRLFIPGTKITLDPKMLTTLLRMMEQGRK